MTMMISKFHKLIQSRLLWGTFLVIIVFSFVVWGMVWPSDLEKAEQANAAGMLDGELVSHGEYRSAYLSTYLARALETAPTDYRIYLALARTRRGATGYPTENDLQTWRLATAYAPQVMSIRREAAQALTEGGRPDEARSLLQSVANDPHSEPQTAPPQTTPQSSDAS